MNGERLRRAGYAFRQARCAFQRAETGKGSAGGSRNGVDTPSEFFEKASGGEKNGVYGDKFKIGLFISGRCDSLGAINRTDTASGREVRAAVSGRQVMFNERFL